MLSIGDNFTCFFENRLNVIRDWSILIAVWFNKDLLIIVILITLYLVYALFGKFFIGKYLDKKNIKKYEQTWDNNRNKDLQEILKRIKKIEKKL